MAASGGVWAPVALRLLRVAANNASKALRDKLSSASRLSGSQLRNASSTSRQPIHPSALLRQVRSGRWTSNLTYRHAQKTVERWISETSGHRSPHIDRSQLPSSRTSRSVSQFTGRAPFASTLRPNLTGGAIGRTQGGYSIGGGARYFSHTPAAPAQVVQNVGFAMRAFLLSGQKARYDGLNEHGNRRYRTVSPLEAEVETKLTKMSRFVTGSFVDFKLSPTVTALGPLTAALPFPLAGAIDTTPENEMTLNRDGLLEVLSEDFGRALKDLATIFADLKRLAVLGDLPITLEGNNTLRVRFPGLDAEMVERLCSDVGLQRGIVGQDVDFNAKAGVSLSLKFPLAPTEELSAQTTASSDSSISSVSSVGLEDDDAFLDEAFVEANAVDNPWLSDAESQSPQGLSNSGTHCSQDFDGLEGIYRFLEECDRVTGRF